MTEMEEKIAKLPAWVREHIKHLQLRSEPLVEEAVKAGKEAKQQRERARRLSDSNEALMEILRCAGRGGSDWAATVVSVLDGYEIFRSAGG